MLKIRLKLAPALCAAVWTTAPTATTANDAGSWAVTALSGVLTEGSWHDAINPGKLNFADAYMLGGALSWDRRIGTSRVSWGIEAQLLGHFGRQDHFEFNVPFVVRYDPKPQSPLKSVAAGLGLSYATKIPQVEIDRNGASEQLFVYWMAEAEFPTRRPEVSTVFRLHHRSDGYGLFDTDAGSTAIVFGLRKRF